MSFYKFQCSLSRASIIIELCIISTCISLYFLIRYVKRKRCIERLNDWYAIKKHHIVETSETCGLLSPHVIYMLACSVKHVTPDDA